MADTPTTHSSVIRTATDAVVAKCSALSAGYIPAVEKAQVYHSLLEKVAYGVCPAASNRRQSPLINAGYAMRMASISFAINTFVSFHRGRDPSTPIQIVFLGCGFDIIGLWSSCLSPEKIQIWEIDTREVCNAKKDFLVKQGLVQPAMAEKECCGTDHFKGYFSFAAKVGNNYDKPISNYNLCAANLRDIESVERAFSLVSTPNDFLPTLVVSELVLVYLGIGKMDHLLGWCNSHLCSSPGSCIVVYEPLGPDESQKSLIESYKLEYCEKFKSKLKRGLTTSKTNPKQISSIDDMFYPIGCSPQSVEDRFIKCGFSCAYACLAGISALYARASGAKIGTSPELFDEHAALTLHLCSYVFACAFSANTDTLLMKLMCPWSSALSEAVVLKPLEQGGDNSRVFFCAIESFNDDAQVRDLYPLTYEELYEKFPAVKKMVHTALKKDLGTTADLDCHDAESHIGNRYRKWGGDFLVAVQYENTNEKMISHVEQKGLKKNIVGGVGLRLCKAEEGRVRGQAPCTYEIHRLFVKKTNRRTGVGKALLNAAENIVRAKSPRGFRIVATTPAILDSANHLYQSCGYTVREETEVGQLIINTYVKENQTVVN